MSKFSEKIRRIFEDSYNKVQWFMMSVGLKLADHKADVVLFTSRKQVETIRLDLRMMLDISHAVDEAARIVMTRLMPTIGDTRQSNRKLLTSVVNSLITYGLTIRGDPIKNHECRRKFSAVHRLGCPYKTMRYA